MFLSPPGMLFSIFAQGAPDFNAATGSLRNVGGSLRAWIDAEVQTQHRLGQIQTTRHQGHEGVHEILTGISGNLQDGIQTGNKTIVNIVGFHVHRGDILMIV